MAVPPRAFTACRPAGAIEEAMVRRRDVDVPRLNRFLLPGIRRGQGPGTLQDFRQNAKAVGPDVKDDEERRFEVVRQ
ncbi:MAG TPA: hypothetical protein VGD78_16275, partial [Chthoniobacterales bacterium]